MERISQTQIIAHRLRAHHLDAPLPNHKVLIAAGACGMQNSVSMCFEHALMQRIEGFTMKQLHYLLYEEKSLVQAWSMRGVPYVFPSEDIPVFLYSLIPLHHETWIYSHGVSQVIQAIKIPFEKLLSLVEESLSCLDETSIASKYVLDQTLAQAIDERLNKEESKRWRSPSSYGHNQSQGEAAVSFMLRACSYLGEIVFAHREGITPSFTSFDHWFGVPSIPDPSRAGELVERFVHCYGPCTPKMFQSWLGGDELQARRLWSMRADEMEEVLTDKGSAWILQRDHDDYLDDTIKKRLLFLSPHDPYLDLKDRDVILKDKEYQQLVWRPSNNPGAIILSGQIIGIWQKKTAGAFIDIRVKLFFHKIAELEMELFQEAMRFANYRQLRLRKFRVSDAMETRQVHLTKIN